MLGRLLCGNWSCDYSRALAILNNTLRNIRRWRSAVRPAFTSKLAGNIYSLYLVQGLNYLLPFLILPYLLRVLGPQSYGAIAFAQSLMAYGVTLTDFGFNFSATRSISVARDNPVEVSRIFWTTLSAKSLLLVGSALFICVAMLVSKTLLAHAAVISVCGLNVVGSVLLPQWYYQGLERLHVMSMLVVLSRAIALLGVFIFVHTPRDVVLAALFLSAQTLIGGIVCLLNVRKVMPITRYRPQWRDLRNALNSSRHLFISNVATSAYTTGNGLILGFVSGDRAVALYTLANKAALAVFYFFMPVVLAVYPRASLLFDKSMEEGKLFVRRLSIPLLIAAGLLSVTLVISARPIVELLGGAQYEGAVPVLRLMGILPVLLSGATVLAQIIMINIGLAKSLSRIYLLMALLSIVLLPVLGTRYGALGGAISLVTVEALGPISMLLVLWRSGFFNVAHT